jgi:branched-chain amino acid aminotransferase
MCARYIQANTNGRLHPADEPSLCPLNRGFLYGDAVYEVWRSYDRVLFAWNEHWSRLEQSATAVFLHLPWTPAHMLREIQRTAAAYRERTGDTGDIYVRLQIYRGNGAIGLDTALADEPGYILLVQQVPDLAPEVWRRGLRLSLARSLRRNDVATLNPAWKTGNYLNSLLGLREARARGADEVLMLNLRNELTEAAVSNVAFVGNGRVVTPPLEAGILAGITRKLLLAEVVPAAGIEVEERTIRPEELGRFSECFLLATTKDLQPVAEIDEYRYQVNDGTVTSRLKAAFGRYAREQAAAHPERRV